MVSRQGGTELLQDAVAQTLLTSRALARLAYTWLDGSPRVVPMWFHWDGEQVVFGGPPGAPKLRALRKDPRVAITIDQGEQFPYKTLLLRGQAQIEDVEGVAPEYASSATRYFGAEQGDAWVKQIAQMGPAMCRIRVRPDWVGIIDFETRFPSAIEKAMAAAGAQSA
jgi:PPOX class probable F420-dependent enzyme